MKKLKIKKSIILIILILTTAILAGCSDDERPNKIRPPIDPEKIAMIEKLRQNRIIQIQEENITQENLENSEEITIEYEPESEIICPEEYTYNKETTTCQKIIDETSTECSEGEYDEDKNACIINIEIEYEPTCPNGELVEKDDEYKCLVSSKTILQLCGDNTCDKFEQDNPQVCPQDCEITNDNEEGKEILETELENDFENNENQTIKENTEEVEEQKEEEIQTQELNYDKSPFGFHPGSTENYRYTKELNIKWSREGKYAFWDLIDPELNGKYTMNGFDGFRGEEINYDKQWILSPTNLKIVANICPFTHETEAKYDNQAYLTEEENEKYSNFVYSVIERYDGDTDYGCKLASPNCYNENDNQYPSQETIEYFEKNPMMFWQICNQPDKYLDFASVQEVSYKAIKKANPQVQVLIGGDSGILEYNQIYQKLNGKYIDIVDFHRFKGIDSYNPKEDLNKVKDMLTKSNFDLSKIKIWITETGTYSGDPQDKGDIVVPYQSEKQQASNIIKRYTTNLNQGIEKTFWAWNSVEGFKLDCGYFDYTGLIYDGCDCQDNKYVCGENIGYDLGRGVKKLGFYTYKKMVEKLEGSNWDKVELVQEQDKIYVFKFTNIETNQPIWVVWNDNQEVKEITLNIGENSNVKITGTIPKYETGKEVTNYETGFKEIILETINNEVKILLQNDEPIYIEKTSEERTNNENPIIEITNNEEETISENPIIDENPINKKCGDNICDAFEQENPQICPIDCI